MFSNKCQMKHPNNFQKKKMHMHLSFSSSLAVCSPYDENVHCSSFKLSGSIGVFGLFNDLSSHQRMDIAGLIFLREKVIDIKGPPNWVIKTIKINIHAKVIFRLWWWREIMMNGEIIGCFDVWSFWRGVALGFFLLCNRFRGIHHDSMIYLLFCWTWINT